MVERETLTWTVSKSDNKSDNNPAAADGGGGGGGGGGGDVQITVLKKWEGRYWPRLLRAPKPTEPAAEATAAEAWSHVEVDWKRWKAEDEDAPPGPATEEQREPAWSDPDSEAALYKPASFRTEVRVTVAAAAAATAAAAPTPTRLIFLFYF